MDILDDEGRILGVVNVIDALVVLLLVAVVVAGGSFLLGTPSQGNEDQPTTLTQQITFRTDPQPEYVIDVIEEGPVPTAGIIAVDQMSVVNPTENGTVVQLAIQLEVSTTDEGLSLFRDERLYVGQRLRLDLGRTIIHGVVVEMGPRVEADER